MKFRVDCPCGRHLMVAEGAAGVTFGCECGRPVAVPSLDRLRAAAGLPAHAPSPELVIEHALQAGDLPPDRRCAGCGARTDDTVRVRVECERTFVRSGETPWPLLLLAGLISPFLLLFRDRHAGGEVHGRNKVYDLPLPVCPPCRPTVTRARGLRPALQRVDLYDRLLEKFPDARLTLLPPGGPS